MKKLDKTKPYGVISGDDEGRMFEQDGVYFTGDGVEWQPPVDGDPDADGHAPLKPRPAAKAKVKVVPAEKAAAPVKAMMSMADVQVTDQLKG